MNQYSNNALANGTLYNETVDLYFNRHRKLTISRMVRETKLSWGFIAGFTQREHKDIEKITKFNNYLKHYLNNPDQI